MFSLLFGLREVAVLIQGDAGGAACSFEGVLKLCRSDWTVVAVNFVLFEKVVVDSVAIRDHVTAVRSIACPDGTRGIA